MIGHRVQPMHVTVNKTIKKGATAGEVLELRRQVERLSLVCQGMWELLRDNTHLDEDLLAAKIDEIDLRDGVRDNKRKLPPARCSRCKRIVQKGQDSCQYCGSTVRLESQFDRVR